MPKLENGMELETSPSVDLPAATDAWLSVVRTYNECTRTLTQQFAPLGITSLQHEILMNLRQTGGLTQQALSARCFSAKSGVSMVVTAFVRDGLITRTRAPDDQRAWNLHLTEKGRTLAELAAQKQAEVVSEMAQGLSLDELAMIQTMMAQAAERLKALRAAR